MKIASLFFIGLSTFAVTFVSVDICQSVGVNRYLALIIGLAFGTAISHVLGRYLPIDE